MADSFINNNMPRIATIDTKKFQPIKVDKEVVNESIGSLWNPLMKFFDDNKNIQPQEIEKQISQYENAIGSYQRMAIGNKGGMLNTLG